jgi:hypothetical protein
MFRRLREGLWEHGSVDRKSARALAYSLREALDISRSGGFAGRAAMTRYDQARTVEKIIGVYNDVLCRFKTRARHRHLLRIG